MSINPKTRTHDELHAVKNPHDWTAGDETVTGAQANHLKTLCDEAGCEIAGENERR